MEEQEAAAAGAAEATLVPAYAEVHGGATEEEKAEISGVSKSAANPTRRIRELIVAATSIRTNNGWPAALRNLARLAALATVAKVAFWIITPAIAATIAALKADFVTAGDVMAEYVETSFFDGWAYLATVDQPGFDAVVAAAQGLTAIALAMLIVFLVCQWRRIPKLTMFNRPQPADKHAKPLVETNHVVLAATTRTWNPRKPITHAGLVLGYSTLLHRFYLSGDKAHCSVQAPPGVGKTVRMVMATLHCIFRSDDSCIVVDPKGELYDNTYEAAVAACGADHVYVVDFFRWRRSDLYNIISDVSRVFFEHLDECEQALMEAAGALLDKDEKRHGEMMLKARNARIEAYAKAEERAMDLATALIPDLPNSNDQFWRPSARTLLRAMVLLVATYREEDWVNNVMVNGVRMPVPSTPEPQQRSLKSVRAILNAMGKAYVTNANGKHEERLPLEDLFAGLDQEHPAARAFTQAKNTKGQTLAGICSTLTNVLDSIVTEESNMMSYATDFDLDKIGEEKTVIYFIVPEAQPAKYAYLPVFITQAYQACARSAARNGGEMKRYVHFILEEFGNSPQIPRFANMVNAGRGYGCRFYAVMQNAAQWSVVYGKDVGDSVIDSLTCRCYLKVGSDAEARTMSEAIGKCMVKSYGTTATYEATKVVGTRVAESETLVSEPYVPIETITSWNPMWGTFVRRGELDKNGLLNRLLFHRKRAVMAVYPTAAPEHIPTLAEFGLVNRNEAAARARILQAKDKTARRAVIPPWLGERAGEDVLERNARAMRPGSIDAATETAFKKAKQGYAGKAFNVSKVLPAAAKYHAEALCTPDAIAAACAGTTRDRAIAELYRKGKKQTDHRLIHAREVARQFEDAVWAVDEERYGSRFEGELWLEYVGTHTCELPKYRKLQQSFKTTYLNALRKEIEKRVQQQEQAA